MKKLILLLFACFFLQYQSFGQAPKKLNSAEIYHAIEKLQFLGSALYIAAHPDDENTRLISYLSNHVKANTAYLSLTRGGGGQNLIGTELADMLGVLRTQELLRARSVDGGNQMFSRAIDFGYSKHPDETLSIWNKEEVLSDVVWAIRKFKPDVIVNRFDHRSPGKTHGHHTSSAMLSYEAFDMTNDPKAYPDQLALTDTWQPKRLFFNTSWWFYGSQEKFDKADKSKMLSVDAGNYYPVLGKSNNEIAAESRSMHKCQGFGSTGTRGSQTEYLELLKGDLPSDGENLFEGVNTSWSRVPGGSQIGRMLASVQTNYDISDPSKSVASLLEVRKLIKNLDEDHWKPIKLAELDHIIEQSLGLYIEAKASDESGCAGESIEIEVEAINRSSASVDISSYKILPSNQDSSFSMALNPNESNKLFIDYTIPSDASVSGPYWLKEKGELGIYKVTKREMIGLAESPAPIKIEFALVVDGEKMMMVKELIYKSNDPVDGEVYQPFNIVPKVSVSLDDKVYIFSSEAPKEVIVKVKALSNNLTGKLELCHPTGWIVSPEKVDIDLQRKGENIDVSFTVTPPAGASVDYIVPLLKIGDQSYTDHIITVDYDHIPKQVVQKDASSKVVKLDIKKAGQKIAYIMGAGDEVNIALKQIGYDVDLMEVENISLANLESYDAVITGIRAYNTLEDLKFKQDILLDYVKNGGNMIIQYNTSRRMSMDNLGPYPMELSRDRVTDETATVTFNDPNHAVLNYPNKITEADFEGWVQERGLYFPGEWDDRYDAIFSMHDKGEDATKGSMLVANYGEGYYIYTGISFFREVPVGIPGAYRLLANMISLGKESRP